MRILFGSGEPYLAPLRGGAECSIDELVRALVAQGHACEVVAGIGRGAPRRRHRLWRLWSASRRLARRDLRNGYPTHRAPPHAIVGALRERLAVFRPDLVVAWNRACEALARAAAAASIPSIVWVHDATLAWSQGGLPPEPATRLAAVSEFLAQRVGERLGRRVAVLRPFIRLDDYRCEARRPEFVTLVSPKRSKGVEIALSIAERMPRRRFLFVGSKGMSTRQRAALAMRVARLRNVRVEPHVSDMRKVYARTALLLVPSICEDAAPRVVLEAHVNGIPVIGSRIGGIPEVSGGAAILLPASAAPERWVA
jgi:glycosyltransferase involved in cell wall biosynthesis